MTEKPIITFDKNLKADMLDLFGLSVDEEGFITEDGTRVIGLGGDAVHFDEWAGLMRGSDGRMIYIRNNIVDLIEVLDGLEKKK